VVEFERFDVGERLRGLEARNARDRRVGPDVEEDPLAHQHARSAIIEPHLERFRSDETPGPQDQVDPGVLVGAQVRGNLAVDHVALALANRHHVDRHATGLRAGLGGVARHVRDVRARKFVFAGHAVHVRTRPADPLALHHGCPSPRSRHVPGQELAACAATKDQDFKPFGCSHAFLQCQKMFRTARGLRCPNRNHQGVGDRPNLKWRSCRHRPEDLRLR